MEQYISRHKLTTEFIPGLIIWVALIIWGVQFIPHEVVSIPETTIKESLKLGSPTKKAVDKPRTSVKVSKKTKRAVRRKSTSAKATPKKATPNSIDLPFKLIKPLNKTITTPRITFKWRTVKIKPSPFYKVTLVLPTGERRVIGTTRSNEFVWIYDELENIKNIKWFVEAIQVNGKKKQVYSSSSSSFSFAGIKKYKATKPQTKQSIQSKSKPTESTSDEAPNKNVVKTKNSTIRIEYLNDDKK